MPTPKRTTSGKPRAKVATKAKLDKPVIDPAQRQALLARVLADPDDDDARRIYADALTAVGDPRGEFIAVQCELAARGDKTENEDKKTKPLWDRFRELHSRHSSKWTKPIKALGKYTRWKFHRGFVRTLHLELWDDATTPAGVASVLAIEPVVDLEISSNEGELAELLELPGIERVRRLGVFGQGAHLGEVPAAATRLGAVVELRLGIALVDRAIQALATSSALPSLRHFAAGMSKCSEETFASFARSPMGQRLETLEWCRADITPAMTKEIVAMPALKTFVASIGYCNGVEDALRERFGAGLVIEDEGGNDYVLEGFPGVSKRTLK